MEVWPRWADPGTLPLQLRALDTTTFCAPVRSSRPTRRLLKFCERRPPCHLRRLSSDRLHAESSSSSLPGEHFRKPCQLAPPSADQSGVTTSRPTTVRSNAPDSAGRPGLNLTFVGPAREQSSVRGRHAKTSAVMRSGRWVPWGSRGAGRPGRSDPAALVGHLRLRFGLYDKCCHLAGLSGSTLSAARAPHRVGQQGRGS